MEFDEFVEKHLTAVGRYAGVLTGNRHLTEDVPRLGLLQLDGTTSFTVAGNLLHLSNSITTMAFTAAGHIAATNPDPSPGASVNPIPATLSWIGLRPGAGSTYPRITRIRPRTMNTGPKAPAAMSPPADSRR